MAGIDESKPFVPLKIAVLTVSDTRQMADDKSGATLSERIKAAGHFVVDRTIVPDDVEAIRARVKEWIEAPSVDVAIPTRGPGPPPERPRRGGARPRQGEGVDGAPVGRRLHRARRPRLPRPRGAPRGGGAA